MRHISKHSKCSTSSTHWQTIQYRNNMNKSVAQTIDGMRSHRCDAANCEVTLGKQEELRTRLTWPILNVYFWGPRFMPCCYTHTFTVRFFCNSQSINCTFNSMFDSALSFFRLSLQSKTWMRQVPDALSVMPITTMWSGEFPFKVQCVEFGLIYDFYICKKKYFWKTYWPQIHE